MKILLTGGAGYIGSHIAVTLFEHGHQPILFDNFSNSDPKILISIEQILGEPIECVLGDIRDTVLLKSTLKTHEIEAVIHLAGLKSVGNSSHEPVEYYSNNVEGGISLVKAIISSGIKRLIFSSSATVYGDPKYLPIDESHPLSATNPYGRTKIYMEDILADLAASDAEWKIACLRYFNPVGAHESGLIGENPNGDPTNLMPYIVRVAAGNLPTLNIFGNDYPTEDGTGIRDYIHVMDLAEGHLAALDRLNLICGMQAINLGTGCGYSVLQMIKAMENVIGKKIPHQFMPRRSGDIAACYAKVTLASDMFGWSARRDLMEMCRSSWFYESNREQ